MSTIEDEPVISKMIKNHGIYPGDPPVAAIYSYYTVERVRVFKVIYPERAEDQILELHASPLVCPPVLLLWSARWGITQAGKEFLDENHE